MAIDYTINETPEEKERRELLIEIRKGTGMTRKAFSQYFDIPCRTMQDWESGARHMPDYVLRLIEYKVHMEGLIKEEK